MYCLLFSFIINIFIVMKLIIFGSYANMLHLIVTRIFPIGVTL